jgi:beta-lactamase regulating signal transducer with metallopeptidase domain
METILDVGLGNAAAATVVALIVAGVARLAHRPALVHTLWVLVLLKLLTPPLIPVTLPWAADPEVVPVTDEPTPTAEVMHPPANGEEDSGPIDGFNEGLREEIVALPDENANARLSVHQAFPWRHYVGICWLAGTVVWSMWLTWHVCRFRRVLRHARRAPDEFQQNADDLARRIGLGSCPTIFLVPGAVSPMVWGLGRRLCLLFPAGLLPRLDAEGQIALLAHELAHVRRRDHWLRVVELVVTALYWWHPVVWWARRELHDAEELCCDAWAVWASGGEGRPYGLALFQAVAFVSRARRPLPEGACGVGQMSHLKRRLTMVMQGNTSRSLSWTGLGLVLALGLLLLPLFPAQGQVQPTSQPAPKDDRDREIDALKKAIEVLENEKRQEPARTMAPARNYYRTVLTADVLHAAQDLQTELEALDKAITVKRKELQDLEARSQALRAQFSAPGRRPVNVRPVEPPRAKQATTPPAKAQDLEQRLERLLREVEDLRREVRQNRPMEVPRLPGLPGAPTPPPANRPLKDKPPAATAAPVEPPTRVERAVTTPPVHRPIREESPTPTRPPEKE